MGLQQALTVEAALSNAIDGNKVKGCAFFVKDEPQCLVGHAVAAVGINGTMFSEIVRRESDIRPINVAQPTVWQRIWQTVFRLEEGHAKAFDDMINTSVSRNDRAVSRVRIHGLFERDELLRQVAGTLVGALKEHGIAD